MKLKYLYYFHKFWIIYICISSKSYDIALILWSKKGTKHKSLSVSPYRNPKAILNIVSLSRIPITSRDRQSLEERRVKHYAFTFTCVYTQYIYTAAHVRCKHQQLGNTSRPSEDVQKEAWIVVKTTRNCYEFALAYSYRRCFTHTIRINNDTPSVLERLYTLKYERKKRRKRMGDQTQKRLRSPRVWDIKIYLKTFTQYTSVFRITITHFRTSVNINESDLIIIHPVT